MTVDETYAKLLHDIFIDGNRRQDRTGVGTKGIFGYQMRFDLREGFPLLSLKYTHFPSVLHEFLWMVVRGDTNTKYLTDHKISIWNEWAKEDGSLGPIYGKQFRDWNGIDQVQELINGLRTNPFSRRHIINLWNVSELPQMALPPCHLMTQWYVRDNLLSLQMYQRSADVGLGLPFNIAFYSIFLSVIAKMIHAHAHEVIITLGDAHIYNTHEWQLWQLAHDRKMYPFRKMPKLHVKSRESINDYTFDDFELEGYNANPVVKLPIAV